MRNDSPDLLTLTQAAEVAGVSLQTFRIYVASGSIAAEQVDGKDPMFRRDAVAHVAALHREAVQGARQTALENLSAELVVMREALSNQADASATVAALAAEVRSQAAVSEGLGEAIAAQRRELEVERTRVDAHEAAASKQQAMRAEDDKRVAEQAKLIEALAAELKETREELTDLGDFVARAIQSTTVSAGALAEQHKITADQARLIESLRADQEESHARIRKLMDNLAEAFGQVQPNGDATSPDKQTKSPPKDVPPKPPAEAAPKAAVAVEPAPEAAGARSKPLPKNTVAEPAKVGVVREIEFNYLMERMGYPRLDAYTPEQLVDAGGLSVPDDEKIKEFLSTYELGCSVAEVEISPVTRGSWQMIQYQRVAVKAGKRPWMGAKR